MTEDKPEILEVPDDFAFKSSGGGHAVAAPTKQMLKAHVKDIKQTKQIDNFKTLPNGDANPNYGKEKTVFIFAFELDESEAKGQEYTAWVSEAVSERSNLGKISDAVLGSPTKILEVTKADLIGMPVQLALRPSKNNPDRLVVDVDKMLAPTADQTRVEVQKDAVATDEEAEQGLSREKLEEVFGPGTKVENE